MLFASHMLTTARLIRLNYHFDLISCSIGLLVSHCPKDKIKWPIHMCKNFHNLTQIYFTNINFHPTLKKNLSTLNCYIYCSLRVAESQTRLNWTELRHPFKILYSHAFVNSSFLVTSLLSIRDYFILRPEQVFHINWCLTTPIILEYFWCICHLAHQMWCFFKSSLK